MRDQKLRDFLKRGPELISPFPKTVAFIDDERAGVPRAECFEIRLTRHSFRTDDPNAGPKSARQFSARSARKANFNSQFFESLFLLSSKRDKRRDQNEP